MARTRSQNLQHDRGLKLADSVDLSGSLVLGCQCFAEVHPYQVSQLVGEFEVF